MPIKNPIPVNTIINSAVIYAIETERVYQQHRWPNHSHSVGEWLLIMEKCLNDAKLAYVCGSGDEAALHEIRQVAATAIAAMEQCGARERLIT